MLIQNMTDREKRHTRKAWISKTINKKKHTNKSTNDNQNIS